MSWAAWPLHWMGMMELIAIVVVVLLVVHGLKKGRRHEQVRRGPRSAPPRGPIPPVRKPRVNIVGLMFAVIFAPVVLCFWGLTSLGDLFALPVHTFVGLLTGMISVFITLIGGNPRRLWRTSGVQFLLAGKALWAMTARLFSCFGMGGLVKGRPKPPPLPGHRRASPQRPVPGYRSYPFEDRYRIESKLGSGGSTARLFVVRRVDGARPIGDRMVLKYFDMGMGSRLEEVIRESRGMQVAKDMGIVLDHHLDQNHFYYVMPYYEGETLTRASARLHRHLLADEGLPEESVRTCLAWMSELLRTLDGYHRQGVIHKDVKPDNLIVTEQGVRLVDLGLLTPVASALTLTTHGTEYFRDPEMVKLAVQGKRVRDVEAVRFDIYSAGAVMYLLLDGSFPACGPLSRISRPVPMALSWITSRAMAEGDKRYPSVAAMRADLESVIAKADQGGYAAIPVSALPSFAGFDPSEEVAPPPPLEIARPEPKMAPPQSVPVYDEPPRPRRSGAGGRIAVGIGAVLMAFVVLGAILLLYGFSGGASQGPRVTDREREMQGRVDSMVRQIEHEYGHTTVESDVPGDPVPPAITPARILASILDWRANLADNLLLNTTAEDLAKVPVLLVGDGDELTDELLSTTKSEMQRRGILFHPSSTLAELVRQELRPEIGAQPVQAILLKRMKGDTLPFVVWVSHIDFNAGIGRCTYHVVCFYGPYRHSATFSPPETERE